MLGANVDTLITDDENRDLRFDVPRKFIALTVDERMIIGRGIVEQHLATYCRDYGNVGVIIHSELFVDCTNCRERRIETFKQKHTFFHKPTISYGQDSDTYWCNHCQGVGWDLAPRSTVVEAFNILTIEEKLRSMTAEEFNKVLLTPTYVRSGYPQNAIKAEAVRRMSIVNAESKESPTTIT